MYFSRFLKYSFLTVAFACLNLPKANSLAPDAKKVLPIITFLVTNTNDSGAGSLRFAIEQANTNAGADTINFNIPGSGPHIISPATALPEIEDDGTVIDATTQPGWTFGQIEITGVTVGFFVRSSDVQIHGIRFNNISVAGVIVRSSAGSGNISHRALIKDCVFSNVSGITNESVRLSQGDDHVIENCLIGTDATGVSDESGTVSKGIQVSECNNFLIKNCLVSGFNDGFGIGIQVNNGTGGIIEDCKIGTDITGSSALPNIIGIYISGSTNFLIENNVISNNTDKGILIRNPDPGRG